MIIQPSHTHDHHSSSQDQQNASVFDHMLSLSEQPMNQDTIDQISRLKRYFEEKVYLSYSNDPSQYLQHMLHKSQNQTKDQVAQLIMSRQMKVTSAIKHEKYDVKMNNDRDKLKKIQDELTGKLQAMRTNIASLSNSDMNSKSQQVNDSQQILNGYMQFRKKGYWNEKSQQSIKVRKFIGKMRKKRKEVQSVHEKNIQEYQKHMKQADQKIKKQQEQERKKIQQQTNKRRQKYNQQKQKKKVLQKKKLEEAQNFLNKYKNNKPIYLLNQQKFKRQVLEPMQAEAKRKLADIKKSKRPIDSQDLQLHQQRYEQFKQKLLQTYDKKQQDSQIYQRNMQKLRQLYHGRFHQQIQQQTNNNSYRAQQEQKKKNREKLIAYGQSVKQEHKPRVDNQKRQQVQKTIKLLEMKSQRGKKRILKGNSVILQQLNPDQHKKLGVSYLQSLKKQNQGKKRKTGQDRSSSMMELHKKPVVVYHDYLKQMRTKSRGQTVRTSENTKQKKPWQKILNQQGFSNRDKYNSVMDHVSLIESEAKQKQIELKYIKNSAKAMQLKQKLDKYYLESVAAKMHVLKDVILKQ